MKQVFGILCFFAVSTTVTFAQETHKTSTVKEQTNKTLSNKLGKGSITITLINTETNKEIELPPIQRKNISEVDFEALKARVVKDYSKKDSKFKVKQTSNWTANK